MNKCFAIKKNKEKKQGTTNTTEAQQLQSLL